MAGYTAARVDERAWQARELLEKRDGGGGVEIKALALLKPGTVEIDKEGATDSRAHDVRIRGFMLGIHTLEMHFVDLSR